MSSDPPRRPSRPSASGSTTPPGSKPAPGATPAPAPQALHNASPTGSRPEGKPTGRVKHDDRGNAIWEWAVATGKFGIDAVSQRLKKLEVPSLSLVDDPPTPGSMKANARSQVKGYNPYDSGQAAPAAKPRKVDLQKLGE